MGTHPCILVLRDDGLVLGSDAITPGADLVVVRWTSDGEELARRLREAHDGTRPGARESPAAGGQK
jgi:hypothetical protein